MNSRTKTTLTITAMAMATLIAIVSIIAVFAAQTQNISTGISVTYNASQIVGKVSAKYYVGQSTSYDSGTAMTTSVGNKTELTFDAGTTLNESLNPPAEIELDPEQKKSSVVFEYVFQNGLGKPISTDYMATLTFNGTADNIKLTTVQSFYKLSASYFNKITEPIDDPTNFTINIPIAHKEGGNNIITKYFYVKAEIDSQLLDSKFYGDFVWNLENWDAPQIDELYNTNNKSFNKTNLDKLLQTISGDPTASTTNLETINQMATEGTTAKEMSAIAHDDIVVTLGGLKWTATYLSLDKDNKPILTLWLDGRYNASNSTDKWSSGWHNTTLTEDYPSNMYGMSYMRSVVLNNGGTYATSGTETTTADQNPSNKFALFTMEENGLTQYLDTPSKVTWQEYGQNAKTRLNYSYSLSNENWSENIPDRDEYNGENYYFNKSGDNYYNYANRTNNSAWKDDYIWLPSLTETGYDLSHIGIWDTSVGQRNVTSGSYSWLRSGYCINTGYAYRLYGSGVDYSDGSVSNHNAVRPALHLNLASAALAA